MTGRIAGTRQTLARYDQENPHTAGRIRETLGGVLVADGLVGLENPLSSRRSRPGILGSAVGIVFSVGFLLLVLWLRERFAGSGLADPVSDPAFDDPFSTDFPAASTDTSQVFDWVFIAMIVIACLMLLVAAVTFVVRLASIGFGVALLRSGRRMTAAHPATDEDPGLVDEARDRLTALLAGPRRDRRDHLDRHDRHDRLDDGRPGRLQG